MSDAPLYCPMCHGQLLSRDSSVEDGPERVAGHKFYCPSCEMLVEPVPSREQAGSEPDNPTDGPSNPGRTTQGGTNAGGSQRGDLSDEGATQWRRDPHEGERNTWQDKPLRPPHQ